MWRYRYRYRMYAADKPISISRHAGFMEVKTNPPAPQWLQPPSPCLRRLADSVLPKGPPKNSESDQVHPALFERCQEASDLALECFFVYERRKAPRPRRDRSSVARVPNSVSKIQFQSSRCPEPRVARTPE